MGLPGLSHYQCGHLTGHAVTIIGCLCSGHPGFLAVHCFPSRLLLPLLWGLHVGQKGRRSWMGVLTGHSCSRSLCSATVAVSLCLTQPCALGLIQCSLELQCGLPPWPVCPKCQGSPQPPWQACSPCLIASICWDNHFSCLQTPGWGSLGFS